MVRPSASGSPGPYQDDGPHADGSSHGGSQLTFAAFGPSGLQTQNGQISSSDSPVGESGVVSVSPENVADRTEKALAERASKRAARLAHKKASADILKEMGNSLFRSQDCIKAAACYVEAIEQAWSEPVYHSNLAAAYLKLELYDEAELAAMHLFKIPNSSKLASVEAWLGRNKVWSKLLLEIILCDDPTNADAEEELLSMWNQCDFTSMADEDPDTTHDYQWPHPNDDKLEAETVSDSSDCNHVGNGIACRFYNHKGCVKGDACAFSHAPDEKSLRDGLGKNICIYYLLSACRFGDEKCIYSHCTDYLPKKGWWNDEEQKAEARDLFESSERNAAVLGSLLRSSKAPNGITRVGKGKGKSKLRGGPLKGTGKKILSHRDRERMEEEMDEMDERMVNGGFTDDEVYELMSQGVKPWDDDAWDVLAALSCDY